MSTLASQEEKLEMPKTTADPEGDEEEVEDDTYATGGTRLLLLSTKPPAQSKGHLLSTKYWQ